MFETEAKIETWDWIFFKSLILIQHQLNIKHLLTPLIRQNSYEHAYVYMSMLRTDVFGEKFLRTDVLGEKSHRRSVRRHFRRKKFRQYFWSVEVLMCFLTMRFCYVRDDEIFNHAWLRMTFVCRIRDVFVCPVCEGWSVSQTDHFCVPLCNYSGMCVGCQG